MKTKCDICSCNLVSENYCTTKKDINYMNTFCYECIHSKKNNLFNFIKNNYNQIFFNKPIIHLDKYEDNFSIDDYFFFKKKYLNK